MIIFGDEVGRNLNCVAYYGGLFLIFLRKLGAKKLKTQEKFSRSSESHYNKNQKRLTGILTELTL